MHTFGTDVVLTYEEADIIFDMAELGIDTIHPDESVLDPRECSSVLEQMRSLLLGIDRDVVTMEDIDGLSEFYVNK